MILLNTNNKLNRIFFQNIHIYLYIGFLCQSCHITVTHSTDNVPLPVISSRLQGPLGQFSCISQISLEYSLEYKIDGRLVKYGAI